MSRRVATSLVLALALGLAACGKADDDEGAAAGGGSVKTGVGVDAETIRLGALPDLSGVFAANGKALMEGVNLYFDGRNKDGGICERQVKIQTQDTGYDPQKAVAAYRQISSDVLGLTLVLGSPVVSALESSIGQDNMVVVLGGWTSTVLPNPNYAIPGATYDIGTINAVDFLMREHDIKDGDRIGHVYFEGDYGENALAGAKYVAGKHGLKLVEQKITPADQDLSGQVAALRRADVDAIIVSGASPQTASLVGVARSVGLDVPIVGNDPSFTPQLLKTPAAKALADNFYTVSSIAPPSADAAQEFVSAFKEKYPKSTITQNGSAAGYAIAQIMGAVLDKACEQKDLTREGLTKAMRSLSAYDSGGTIAGTLDFSDPAKPPTREVYVSKVDPDAEGGLTAVGEPFASEDAKAYEVGGS